VGKGNTSMISFDGQSICLPAAFVLRACLSLSVLFFALGLPVFLRELVFYRKNHWNYEKDSGQYVFLTSITRDIFNYFNIKESTIGQWKLIIIFSWTIIPGIVLMINSFLIFIKVIIQY
jgi:hypothetical protein